MAQDENSTYAADGEGNDSGADAQDRTHASGISRIGSLYIKGGVGPILRGLGKAIDAYFKNAFTISSVRIAEMDPFSPK